MAKVVSELNEYIGISNTTITKGLVYDIEVVIPEFIPLAEGCPGKYTIEQTTLEDPIHKTTKTTKVKTVRTVVCTYMGSGNTNGLVPCVHKGERVRVLNYAGTEQYYWQAYGKDPGLRLRERARWFVMDQPKSVENGDYKKVEDANTYFVELNTNKGAKEFHVHTSTNDGETYTYDIRIIPEKCILEITDNAGSNGPDKGNVIRLSSKERWWHIRNTDESVIDINKKNIIIRCQDTISLIAGKNIVSKCGMNKSEFVGLERISHVGTDVTEVIGANKTELIGSDLDVQCANINSNSSGEGTVSSALQLLAASSSACSSVTESVASQGAGTVSGLIPSSVFGFDLANVGLAFESIFGKWLPGTGGTCKLISKSNTIIECKERHIRTELDITEKCRNRKLEAEKQVIEIAGELHQFLKGNFACDCPKGHTGSIILIGSNVWDDGEEEKYE